MCILKIVFNCKSSVYLESIVVCILKIIFNYNSSVYFDNIVACILKIIFNYNSSVYFENIVVCMLKIIFNCNSSVKIIFICISRCVARSFLGQGRFLQIRAQIFGSFENQSYL